MHAHNYVHLLYSGLFVLIQLIVVNGKVTYSQLFCCCVCCGQMADWLESEFLDEQVKSIKELSEYITNLKRVGTGLGEYMFDKETLDD